MAQTRMADRRALRYGGLLRMADDGRESGGAEHAKRNACAVAAARAVCAGGGVRVLGWRRQQA